MHEAPGLVPGQKIKINNKVDVQQTGSLSGPFQGERVRGDVGKGFKSPP